VYACALVVGGACTHANIGTCLTITTHSSILNCSPQARPGGRIMRWRRKKGGRARRRRCCCPRGCGPSTGEWVGLAGDQTLPDQTLPASASPTSSPCAACSKRAPATTCQTVTLSPSSPKQQHNNVSVKKSNDQSMNQCPTQPAPSGLQRPRVPAPEQPQPARTDSLQPRVHRDP